MGRRIVIIRHGERMDYTFSKDWWVSCFPDGKTYQKIHDNMPDTVPVREGMPSSFHLDSPLTLEGLRMGRMSGQGFKEHTILREGFQVYVSPSLRSIQTATGIIQGMDMSLPLKIEPCLYEWMGSLEGNPPLWMSLEELKANGVRVDETYKPYLQVDELNKHENTSEVYRRSRNFINHLLSQSDKNDILLCGHGGSLDAFSCDLVGKEMGFYKVRRRVGPVPVPYCGAVLVEQDEEDGTWTRRRLPKDMGHDVCKEFCAVKLFDED